MHSDAKCCLVSRSRTPCNLSYFFFFNDTATTEIYTLSLHDALPISPEKWQQRRPENSALRRLVEEFQDELRSEEHTSELQSRRDLVCRLLLEKKKNNMHTTVLISMKHTQATIRAHLITTNSRVILVG